MDAVAETSGDIFDHTRERRLRTQLQYNIHMDYYLELNLGTKNLA